MKDVLEDVDAWTARGDAVALATVISVKRSAPRPPGSKMAINETGEISGAVSGGCVEGAVVEVAEEVLSGKSGPRLLHRAAVLESGPEAIEFLLKEHTRHVHDGRASIDFAETMAMVR